MVPDLGFLIEVIEERIVAQTEECSKAKSALGSKVQSSIIRFSQ